MLVASIAYVTIDARYVVDMRIKDSLTWRYAPITVIVDDNGVHVTLSDNSAYPYQCYRTSGEEGTQWMCYPITPR